MTRSLCSILLTLAICCILPEAQERPVQDKSLLGPVVTFDPAHQKPLSYSDESVEVRLIVGKEQDSLSIVTRAARTEKRVDLPSEMAQVDEIRRVTADKLVVLGMINGSGSQVAIKVGELIDKFACYSPVISARGGYIAFIKFYPAHFAEGIEDHYMLYNLSASPAENRPPGVGADNWLIAGGCVYPVNCGNEPGDNNGVPENNAHLSRSLFVWNPEKEEVFFADQRDSSGPITLVVAKIGVDGRAVIRTFEQDTEDLCPNKSPSTQPCSLLVRKAVFHPSADPRITAVFEVVNSHQLKTVDYKLSQFR